MMSLFVLVGNSLKQMQVYFRATLTGFSLQTGGHVDQEVDCSPDLLKLTHADCGGSDGSCWRHRGASC